MEVPSFAQFIANNGILAASAGITIGFATATFVKSFVADVIMPVIFLLVLTVNKKASGFVGHFLSSKELRFTNFISELITWVLIIGVAFLTIELIRKHLLNKSQPSAPVTYANPMLPTPTKEHYAPLVRVEDEEYIIASNYDDSMMYLSNL